jgi:hypothetical protein
MALQKKLNTVYGVEIPNAYFQVGNVIIQNKSSISFNVNSYKDKSFQSITTFQYICDYDINGENPIKQAYLHLKTLPEFVDAVDC